MSRNDFMVTKHRSLPNAWTAPSCGANGPRVDAPHTLCPRIILFYTIHLMFFASPYDIFLKCVFTNFGSLFYFILIFFFFLGGGGEPSTKLWNGG